MANLQLELSATEAPNQNLEDAKVSAKKIADQDPEQEMDHVLNTLLAD
jgi:hypothetical protein